MTAPSDRDEIVELTHRYASAIDDQQYARLAEVFTEDADIDYGEVGHWTGAAEVAQFMEAVHVGAAHTMHRMTNQVINVDGDRASVRTYVDALILTADGSGVNPVGYYDDVAVRTAAGWRIAQRSYTSVRLVAVGS
ncbi:nuclear transport factor 2 family protein [Mycobacterium sp. 1274761.0]|uniref:nuclear transport factor 2 family protein n=1 Tax=Mycobacterium sp. 1274761.0 TaxID=1834077 RepID=UPI000802342D|nr:nuclear transport factor 2 family protein [Mycobacterium sp. 1274761.0]OBK71715.1 polyketide cyclase [Mycobacterium sp. 1274761.0]